MRTLIVLSVVTALVGPAVAQETATGAAGMASPLEIVHQTTTVDVNADGTFTQTSDQLILLVTQQGVQALPAALVAYSDSMQEGELLQVYTLKPDGKRIDAALDQVLTRSAPMALQAPMFDDVKIKALPFANVAVGDKVGFVVRVRQKTPYIPGQFTFAQTFSRVLPVADTQLIVTAPKSGLPLHVEVAGLDNKPPVVVDGKTQWSWSYKNDTPEAPEPNAVADFDVLPHVVISSLPDYAALAKAYESRARDKAAVTPEIQALADKVTNGTADKREQARRLYEWVSANIKYVAINLGVGAIVPHSAAEVLGNLYGDCKDHVTLLQALLKAKGIDSSGALINTATTYKMPTIATLQQFNHIITYIPELKLYLDSTARYAPFGVLPAQDIDKTVLLTATGKLDHTPWDPASSVLKMVTTLKVHDDGSADGESKMSASGRIAITMRTTVASVAPQQEQNFLQQILGASSGAALERGTPDVLNDPYEFGVRFKLPNYLQMPGPGAISFSPGPRMGGRPAGIANMMLLPHHRDFICPDGRYIEEMSVELPASIKVSSLPQAQEVAIEGAKMQTTYTRDGDTTIKATRTLEMTPAHHVCSAERTAALRADFVKLNGLLGAQALYDAVTASAATPPSPAPP